MAPPWVTIARITAAGDLIESMFKVTDSLGRRLDPEFNDPTSRHHKLVVLE